MRIRDLLGLAPVMPVLVIHDVAHAVPLAKALVAGGLPVLEITLRTDAALPAVQAIAEALPAATVGVGTVTQPGQFALAQRAGARFAISPGFSLELARAAGECGLPWLPAAMTPSEVMVAVAAGFDTLKFFPAQAAGGVALLKAFAGPFPDVAFCPTGGITAETCRDYLRLPNVVCVGGTWLAPVEVVQAGRWEHVETLARAARAT
jgi:2-dehydro-3-deoxyphosphogluconate aldolase/(4S)-4-hydroxy-2-oxoglutarate aldolase